MSNSSLVCYTKWSPHCTKPRNGKIRGISIHTMAGNGSIEGCGQVFQTSKASSHYGIGSDGRIGQYVDEKDRAWCCSHSVDHSVITIEVASIDNYKEPYRCTDAAYKSLINLCVDICKRNGIKKLVWKEGKQYCPAFNGKWDVCNMVPHRYTTDKGKSCPGNYLFSKYGDIAKEVNKRLNADGDELDMTKQEFLNSLSNEEAYNLLMKAYTHMTQLPESDWSIKEGHWQKATANEVTTGEKPRAFITREETMALLGRILGELKRK